MTRKAKLLITYCLLFFTWMVFSSRSDNPPNGRTNAPFDGFCTGCHSPSSLNGTVSISGIPSTVEGGTTYSVTVTVEATTAGAVRAGFQMVSVFDNGNTNAGDFVPNSNDEGTNTSGGREYVEHRGAKNFSSNVASWTFDWVAPDGPDGASITMYYAGNIANGGGSSGDRPVSGNSSFTLSAASAPLAASIASKVDVDCNGENTGSATAEAEGGSTPYSYAWSNGGNTATINNLSAGDYTVTVTDNDNETSTASVTINEPTALEILVSASDPDCNGENSGSASASASGGSGSFSYSWSNGMNTATISNVAAGSYGVTATDANGCTISDMVTLSEPAALSIMASSTDETANMANDGTAEATASGGSGGFTYAWSNGDSGSSIDGLAGGTYAVTATDANGCEIVDMVTVQAFDCGLSATVSSVDVDCHGDSTGSASVSVSGAVQPVTYSWSNGLTTSEVEGLAAGMYDVTVEDGAACQEILAVMIEESTALSASLVASHLTCPDDSTGSLMVLVSGGSGNHTYLWSSGGTLDTESGLPVGSYSVSVTDENGCQATFDTSLVANDDIPPQAVVVDTLTVYLDTTGQATVSVQMIEAGSSDNCSIVGFALPDGLATCTDLGTKDFAYVVVDQAGNADTATVSVGVVDTVSPVFTFCMPDITVDSGAMVTYDMPVATDNCGVDTLEMLEGLPSGSEFPVGETKVSYLATDDSGNYACCSFFVTVEGQSTDVIDLAFTESINLFPNPVEDWLRMSFSSPLSSAIDLEIVDLSGSTLRRVQNQFLTDGMIEYSMEGINAGIYFVRIRQDDKIALKKLVKR